ncbi:MAG: 50S ribosome-binding GTPase [Planctomycetaceae bacterium]|jgi:MinD-like ATPase involved in chromosome partitioning or flagellar assembly|nr:50S ribosome-binding GTPase [Planctomycetaceae bacterium]
MSLTSSVETGELFIELSELVIEFDRVVGNLCGIVGLSGVSLPVGADWYELLSRKLLPQMGDSAYLIVSVMGGTNTGKSMIFNHLAGDYCSGVDYRASGTKHPVCIVSGLISDPFDILRRNFCNFNLSAWSRSDQPFESGCEHQLFWKADNRLPDRLLILDTPDIDSDNELNWLRARGVRHAADVIIAVLTSQKYNDAAIRRFFREAAEAAKPIIVIFNMINFDRDAEHIPAWLNQFCEETRSVPIVVLAAPFDNDKSAKLQLPFYRVLPDGAGIGEVVDLRRVLTELHFDRIKSQTLLGAIRVIVDEASGLPSFLSSIEFASGQFEEALDAIERADGKTEIELPAIPVSTLANEVRDWWHNEKRPLWSRKINDIYSAVGGKLVYPFIKLRGIIVQKLFPRAGNTSDQGDDNMLRHFKDNEERAVVAFIEAIFNRLERLTKTDNLVLRREMLGLTGGERRVEILERAKVVLNEIEPVDASFRDVIKKNLAEWTEKNPVKTNLIQSLDQILTLVRPVVTVSLLVGGFVIGAVMGVPLVVNVILMCGVAVGGELIMYAVAETIKSSLARLIKHVQEEFIVSRSKNFHAIFLRELWSDVMNRLKSGTAVAKSKEFQDCQNCLKKAAKKLSKKLQNLISRCN